MLVTVIPVIYQDTNGIRMHGELRLDGVLTGEQVRTLKSALYGGRDFVPGQMGLTHYGAAESSAFPGPNDHGWHMLLVDDAIIVDDSDRCWSGAGAPEFAGTPEQFLSALRAVANSGWVPEIHAA